MSLPAGCLRAETKVLSQPSRSFRLSDVVLTPSEGTGIEQVNILKNAHEVAKKLGHRKYTLRFTCTGCDSSLLVSTALFVRGAKYRSYAQRLCSATGSDPEEELRSCKDLATKDRPIPAAVFVHVPGSFPSLREIGAGMRALPSFQEKYDLGRKLYETLQVCENECPEHLAVSLSGFPWTEPFMKKVFGQSNMEWERIAVSFIVAALTLPQPFSMIELGNLCGGVTILLAVLKRKFCPSCEYLSADPGGFRLDKGQPFSCARDSVKWAGVDDQVILFDNDAAELQLSKPLGFVYLDGGKLRYFNQPFISRFETEMMVGAVLSLDDPYQDWETLHAKHHAGQIMLSHEMVLTGDFKPLLIPQVSNKTAFAQKNIPEIQRLTRTLQDQADMSTHCGTIILQKVRSLQKLPDLASEALLRLSITNSDGLALDEAWLPL